MMLKLWLVCVLVCVLLIQVLGLGKSIKSRKAKARKACSPIQVEPFLGKTVEANYAIGEAGDVVSLSGCPADPRKTLAFPPRRGPLEPAMRALMEIKEWVCYNLRQANAAGVKTYIDPIFYVKLVNAIESAQISLQWLAGANGIMHNADALEIAELSFSAQVIQMEVAHVVRRLPCFCRLLKLMKVPLKSLRGHNNAICRALHGEFITDAFDKIHKAATEEFWKPTVDVAQLVPKLHLIRRGTCTEVNLISSWWHNHPTSWFECAAKYNFNGYEVYMAPEGLMLYHGSLRMQPMHVPTGMMWFGEKRVASAYLDQPHKLSAVAPAVHSFRTKKNIFLVQLMHPHNNKLMAALLPPQLPLEFATGYPHQLRRNSHVDYDKAIFAELCRKWPPGIVGYADNYPPPSGNFHPEVMLCNTPPFVEPLGTVERSPPRTVKPVKAVEPEPEAVEKPKPVARPRNQWLDD